jgi:hypothetical protein
MTSDKEDKRVLGIVTSRGCPTCGHHEIGYIAGDGEFHALRTGDRIQVFETGPPEKFPEPQKGDQGNKTGIGVQEKDEILAWVPGPVKSNRTLAMKYGVLFNKEILSGGMTGTAYETAFIQKLRRLIEKETFTPLPVILDRFLSAPNLASGNPKQIAQALFDELYEIREPVKRIREWLEKRDNESLERMIYPISLESLNGDPLSDNEIKEGLESLTLEDFLEML